jgi:hypothetical protein
VKILPVFNRKNQSEIKKTILYSLFSSSHFNFFDCDYSNLKIFIGRMISDYSSEGGILCQAAGSFFTKLDRIFIFNI